MRTLRGMHAPDRALLWCVLRAHWAIGLVLFLTLTDAPRLALLGAAVSFFAGAALDLGEARAAAWHRLSVPLLLVTAAAAAADILLLGADVLSAISILVLGIQSIKLLLPKRARDGWQLCAISYLEFLTAAAVTDDVRFAAFIFLFVFLSVGAMWELQIQGAAEKETRAAPRDAPRFAAKLLVVSGTAGAILTALLFVLTPRVGIGQLLARHGRAPGITGFSNSITLRDVTAIKADRRVVARIEFPTLGGQPPPGELHFRGVTYSRFDGRSWTRSAAATIPVPRAGYQYLLGLPTPRGAAAFVADIMLEPMEQPAVFVYGNPSAIEGGLGWLNSDGEGNFEFARETHGRAQYRLTYSTGGARPRGAAQAPDRKYLDLPAGSDDVRDLALRITAGADSPSARAEQLRRFFRTGFRYSLKSLPGTLNDFLFARRAGHCEHFATALTMLLRAAGVPARVAAGYLGGEWSDVGQYLIVRQSDAHAWTEAWLDGMWVTMDATPPLGESSPFVSRTSPIGIYIDWVKERWDKYVMNFSLKIQADTVIATWQAVGTLRAALARSWAAGRGHVLQARNAAVILLLVAGGFVAMRLLRGSWRAVVGRTAKDDARALPKSYAALLRALERSGYRASAGTTLERMLIDAAARRSVPDADVLRFLSLYHRDRFGAGGLPTAERLEASLLADRLRSAV